MGHGSEYDYWDRLEILENVKETYQKIYGKRPEPGHLDNLMLQLQFHLEQAPQGAWHSGLQPQGLNKQSKSEQQWRVTLNAIGCEAMYNFGHNGPDARLA